MSSPGCCWSGRGVSRGTHHWLLSTGKAGDNGYLWEVNKCYPILKQKSRAILASSKEICDFASGRKAHWVIHSCQWVPSGQIWQLRQCLNHSWICLLVLLYWCPSLTFPPVEVVISVKTQLQSSAFKSHVITVLGSSVIPCITAVTAGGWRGVLLSSEPFLVPPVTFSELAATGTSSSAASPPGAGRDARATPVPPPEL